MIIRPIASEDYDPLWEIFKEVVAAGDTYPYSPKISKDEALDIWVRQVHETYVAIVDDVLVGTYYLKPNNFGRAEHVCNCGYMVSSNARGQGVGAAMCEHSQEQAVRLGYKAMQFNLVVSTNAGAIRLWKKMGFEIVGTLPKAFRHESQGFVDAYVMYKWLAN